MTDFYDPNGGLLDPYYELALQMQFMPEYSATRGWLPPDIGTMQSNNNYYQDVFQNAGNPLMAGMSGAVDPRALESTFEADYSGAPERPDLGALDLYRQSNDPIMNAIIVGLGEGRPPYDVIATLKESGLLPPDQEVPQADGSIKRVEDPRAAALLQEATNLQTQIAAEKQYESQSAAFQPSVKETPSPLAEQYRKMGLPLPTEEYSVESLAPQLGEMSAYRGAADQERDALYKALEAKRREGKPSEFSLTGLGPRRGHRGTAERTGTRGYRGTEAPTPASRGGVSYENTASGRRNAASERMAMQSEYMGAAQRAANAQLAELLTRAEARSSAAIAQAQGRTPYKDAIAARLSGGMF